MSLLEAENLALKVLKQVMEEKLTATNIQVATVTPSKGFHICTESELQTIIGRL
jgi:20S proteasome subunit alpha 5